MSKKIYEITEDDLGNTIITWNHPNSKKKFGLVIYDYIGKCEWFYADENSQERIRGNLAETIRDGVKRKLFVRKSEIQQANEYSVDTMVEPLKKEKI